MMTAVLNPFLNYTEAQIRASCAHALLTHTTESMKTEKVTILLYSETFGMIDRRR